MTGGHDTGSVRHGMKQHQPLKAVQDVLQERSQLKAGLLLKGVTTRNGQAPIGFRVPSVSVSTGVHEQLIQALCSPVIVF